LKGLNNYFYLFINCFSPIIIYPLPEPEIVVIKSSSFTLQWDNPEYVTPDSFNLYYKQHGTTVWKPLGNTVTNITEFLINYSALDGGIFYDFGVSAVYINDDSTISESTIHSSLDRSAVPKSGWYIKWVF